ncbi:hypothetical protein H5410_027860 [Solanum commersonii]|uniref:Uncharacterized protein n=1 Tax=Solanum commersonii TaxID=4109 RepID=A0A9J5Z336_SOLCO|nr:hypothetical protein H5410_027860 [Solanum commersonii]
MRNYLGGSPSAVHREYKCSDKGPTRSLSVRCRMRSVTSCFSPKVTEFNIIFGIKLKVDGDLRQTAK